MLQGFVCVAAAKRIDAFFRRLQNILRRADALINRFNDLRGRL